MKIDYSPRVVKVSPERYNRVRRALNRLGAPGFNPDEPATPYLIRIEGAGEFEGSMSESRYTFVAAMPDDEAAYTNAWKLISGVTPRKLARSWPCSLGIVFECNGVRVGGVEVEEGWDYNGSWYYHCGCKDEVSLMLLDAELRGERSKIRFAPDRGIASGWSLRRAYHEPKLRVGDGSDTKGLLTLARFRFMVRAGDPDWGKELPQRVEIGPDLHAAIAMWVFPDKSKEIGMRFVSWAAERREKAVAKLIAEDQQTRSLMADALERILRLRPDTSKPSGMWGGMARKGNNEALKSAQACSQRLLDALKGTGPVAPWIEGEALP